MKNPSVTIFTALVVLMLAVGAVLATHFLQPESNTQAGQSATPPEIAPQAGKTVASADLAFANQRLKADLARVQQQLAEARLQLKQQGWPQTCPALNPVEPGDETPETVSIQHIQDLGLAAESGFFTEPVATAWADAAQETLRAAWPENAETEAAARMINLECRSTTCRIEVEYTQAAMAGAVENRWLAQVGSELPSVFRQTEQLGSKEKVVYYLSRAI